MWQILSGSIYNLQANPGQFQKLKQKYEDKVSVATAEIERVLFFQILISSKYLLLDKKNNTEKEHC